MRGSPGRNQNGRMRPSEKRALWESQKIVLHDLWVKRNLNLRDVNSAMKLVANFEASPKRYKMQFKKWGWEKFERAPPREPAASSAPPEARARHHRVEQRRRLPPDESRRKAREAVRQILASKSSPTAISTIPAAPAATLHSDSNLRSLYLILTALRNYLQSCPSTDPRWVAATSFDLIGRSHSKVMKCLAYAILAPPRHGVDIRGIFEGYAFMELENELIQGTRNSVLMWDLLINVPQLCFMEGQHLLLEKYLLRFLAISQAHCGQLAQLVLNIFSMVRSGSCRQFISTTSEMWADELMRLRGSDRSALNAAVASIYLGKRASPSLVVRISAAYDQLVMQVCGRRLGDRDNKIMGLENARLTAQYALGHYLPDFESRSSALVDKLRFKNAGLPDPATWDVEDQYLFFRTFYRLYEFFTQRGEGLRAFDYFQVCEALPHDLRFRGLPVAVDDLRFKILILADIQECRRLKADHWFRGLPDPSRVMTMEEFCVLMGGVLQQHIQRLP